MIKRIVLLTAGLLFAGQVFAATELQPLVDVQWLQANKDNADVVVLDVRNTIDGGSREVFEQGHIPGAVYSNYAQAGWRVKRDGVVAKLPPVADLEALIGALGIDNESAVVVVPAGVGATDFGSAARVYWTFKVLGHDRVAILDGGYKAWVAAGAPVEQGWNAPEAAAFQANFRPRMVADTADVEAAMAEGIQLVDSRPAEHFLGRGKHPAARAAGTIPGAINLEQQKLVKGESTEFVSRETLQQLIDEAEVAREPTITFCNTGHWASTGWFALSEIAGYQNVTMYDGSMVEWAADESRPLQVEKRGLQKLLSIFD
ncbi:sulfurtransferase [Alkalilimnicola sp. S0819]|uniref:sulfurtransferase n=1 Tax=Alkalilimnicola sp. S0819 TaxID=2613922 RepID=UPI001261B5B8|nr:sulfurtransferase [Alkalilimnicola sp. S0819]KAB7619637.1 sulfurtransferase [Alkalilimnicola sp. S0819]MPQ17575.1 sulfurtransferase [Alkalilimnicola sp. S0819]